MWLESCNIYQMCTASKCFINFPQPFDSKHARTSCGLVINTTTMTNGKFSQALTCHKKSCIGISWCFELCCCMGFAIKHAQQILLMCFYNFFLMVGHKIWLMLARWERGAQEGCGGYLCNKESYEGAQSPTFGVCQQSGKSIYIFKDQFGMWLCIYICHHNHN